MFAASSFNLRNLCPTSASLVPEPNPQTPRSSSVSLHGNANANVEPQSKSESNPQFKKPKGSPQLNRWSRARAVRLGRKLDRLSHGPKAVELPLPAQPRETAAQEPNTLSLNDAVGVDKVGKSIYMVSDGTGWTAEHSVNAALGQFEHCLVDRGCPVNTHLFSGVSL